MIDPKDLTALGLKDEKRLLRMIRSADQWASRLEKMSQEERNRIRKVMQDRYFQPGEVDQEALEWLTHDDPFGFINYPRLRERILQKMPELPVEVQRLRATWQRVFLGVAFSTCLAVIVVLWKHGALR